MRQQTRSRRDRTSWYGLSVVALLFLVIFPFWVSAQRDSGISSLENASFSIVSPLEGDRVNGTVVFVTKPEHPEKITQAQLTLVDSPENHSFSQRISSESHWYGEWDSSAHPPGSYVFDIRFCSDEDCQTKSVTIHVERAREPSRGTSGNTREELGDASENDRANVQPSNHAGAVTFFTPSTREPIARSAGGPVSIPRQPVDVRLSFFKGAIREMNVERAPILGDGQLSTIHSIEGGGVFYYENESWVVVDGVDIEYSGSYKKEIILYPAAHTHVFWCENAFLSLSVCEKPRLLWQSIENFTIETNDEKIRIIRALPEKRNIPEKEIEISASNIAGVFSFTPRSGKKFTSNGDPIRLPAGIYDVLLEWDDFPVTSLQLENTVLRESGTVLSWERIPTVPSSLGSENDAVILSGTWHSHGESAGGVASEEYEKV
ncbi:MAG: hypothetical protein AABY11_03130, partial [archaeon]